MISDNQARAASLDPDRSYIVQAPAGSGKTGLLVYRLLRLLVCVENPQQVLAITFTRKAVAELRGRVFELLSKAQEQQSSDDPFEQQGIDLAQAVLQHDKKLNWNLLDSPHQLAILTIDSFSARLATSMPWLSRLGDRPQTTDNADRHYAAAVEQLLNELLHSESELADAIQTVLMELDFNYNKARRLFSSMLEKREQWLRHLLQSNLSALRSNLEQAWQAVANEQLSEVFSLVDPTILQELVGLAQHASQNIRIKEQQASPLAAFENFERSVRLIAVEQWQAIRFLLLTQKAEYRKSVTVAQGFVAKSVEKLAFLALLEKLRGNDEFRLALADVAALPALRFSDDDWNQIQALELVLKSLAAHLQLRFRATGECDHSEVTQRANSALQELDKPTDLGLRMDYQLQHILVDEFQDTSHGQIELLKRLTAGWSGETGDQKTLFLVGDPMQSIYRFREADVSLFLRVANNAETRVFENLNIESLALTENFRSSANLISWFNSSFGCSFAKKNNVLLGAIRYAPASSSHVKSSNSSVDEYEPPVEYHFAADKQVEMELLVGAVQAALNNLPNAQAKVAILVRSRSQLEHLLPGLQAAGIHYLGIDIQALKGQQAVIDVLALSKALCREDDRISWLALLRGPWCGLTLTEIKDLVPCQQRTIWQQLELWGSGQSSSAQGLIAPDTNLRLARFISVMRAALKQRQQVNLSELVRWTWSSLGGQQTLFGANIKDVDTVFDLIHGLQRGGDLPSISELDKAMEGLYAQPVLSEQSEDAGAQAAQLVVSTIHKAKGLQFHTVILPSLASPARASNKEILMWSEYQNNSGESQLLLAPFRLEQDSNGAGHYNYLRLLDRKRAAQETIRLMYVASTRAEKKLVLIANGKLEQETGEIATPGQNSLLATIWTAIGDQFKPPNVANQTVDQVTTYPQRLARLPGHFRRVTPEPVKWSPVQQLNAQEQQTEQLELEQKDQALSFEWASDTATAIGIVLHDWLQFSGSQVIDKPVDQQQIALWRSELLRLRVPVNRLDYALQRLSKGANNIINDPSVHFLFRPRHEQQNEAKLAVNENGLVNHYRIDRTFVDDDGTRWIVDYKSTDTQTKAVANFVDEQVALRHLKQMHKYGSLMRQLDDRPIKLAVYFPMLGELRSWDYIQ